MADLAASEQSVQEDLQAYLSKHNVNSLFIEIVEALLLEKPDNPIGHIVNFLKEKYPEETEEKSEEKAGLEEYVHDSDSEEEDDDDDEEDEDEMGELVEMKKAPSANTASRGRRISVSAGVMSSLPVKPPPVFEKTDEESDHLRKILAKNMLCSHLEADDLEILVKAMEKRDFESDTNIIKQGDDEANYYYVLDTGSAEVIKNEKVLLTYEEGAGFGELALMYNAPRAATVRAVTPCTVWQLDRDVFKSTLVSQTQSKRKKYASFLKKIKLLEPLKEYEILTLADALESKTFEPNAHIVTEGDEGNEFYIIKEGTVSVWQKNGEEKVGQLAEGDYFGEIALLTNKPRQATVMASDNGVEVLTIDRKSFQRILGKVSDILQRQMVLYNQIMLGKGHV